MHKKRFLINAAITSSTSMLINLVGVSFNIYISNKVGAAGVGLFQLIMSVYSFAVTLATSGINLAATRLVADELALKEKNASEYVMKRCLAYSAAFGLLSFFLLFSFSDYIAIKLLGDSRTELSLKALSISMPPIAMSSAMSGYFVATRRIYKSASAQIFEQIIKIAICVISLELFSSKGIEYACLCIVLSGSLAEISSFLYLYILYFFDSKRYKTENKRKHACFSLFNIALPVALSTYLRSALVTIEHILIPKGLKQFGMDSDTALKCYGTIHGMTLSILLFPSAVLKAFSGLLVPELSECATLGQKRRINHIASGMIKVSMIFSICISGIFFSFAEEIGMVIYKNNEVGFFLRLLAPLSVIMYVDSIVDGMLKGLNQQLNSMFYNIFDSAVSVLAVIVLLPKYGAAGYIAVIYISELLNAFLSINRLIKITDFKVMFFSWIALPSVSIYAAGMLVKALCRASFGSCSGVLWLIIKMATCIIIYLFILVASSVIDVSPIKRIRHGKGHV